MTRPTDHVSGRYGAPLGRADEVIPGAEGDEFGRFRLFRVRLDSGGYDAGGSYWGLGAPLYYFEGEHADGDIASGYLRGSRDYAKQQVRERYPAARFYR
jgi:hypothetical protein